VTPRGPRVSRPESGSRAWKASSTRSASAAVSVFFFREAAVCQDGHVVAGGAESTQFGEEPIAEFGRCLRSEDGFSALGITGALRRTPVTAVEPTVAG